MLKLRRDEHGAAQRCADRRQTFCRWLIPTSGATAASSSRAPAAEEVSTVSASVRLLEANEQAVHQERPPMALPREG